MYASFCMFLLLICCNDLIFQRKTSILLPFNSWCSVSSICHIIFIDFALFFLLDEKKKGYGIRLYSPYRRCWSPFLGPSERKCNGGLGANHPVLLHTLPVYLPQIYPGTHLELGRLWLSLQSHATEPRPKLNNWVHWDSNPRPFRQRIPNPANQPTRLGRVRKVRTSLV